MANNTTDAAGSQFSATAEAAEATFRNGFEKAAKNYDRFLGFGKETVEAYVKAAAAAGKGVETFHAEVYGYSKQSFEDSLAAAKAVLASKSVHEAMEVQSDFVKTAFDAYVGRVAKLNDIVVAATKQAFEPLQSRAQAWMETVHTTRTV